MKPLNQKHQIGYNCRGKIDFSQIWLYNIFGSFILAVYEQMSALGKN